MALNREPSMKPRAMPIESTPLANPNWRPINHIPQVFRVFMVTTGERNPETNIAASRVPKSLARPRRATVRPDTRQARINTRFGPKRSAMAPPARTVAMPGSDEIPQIRPTWTRLRCSSVEISLNSTDMLIIGAATTSVLVRVDRARISQRVLGEVRVFSIMPIIFNLNGQNLHLVEIRYNQEIADGIPQ